MPTLTTPAVTGLVLALLLAGLFGYLATRAWRKFYQSPRMILARLGQRRLSDLVIPDGTKIGYDLAADRRKGYTVTESGIVVVPRTD